ncbi:hypothetical protein D3C76_1511600 [compost metagenome]
MAIPSPAWMSVKSSKSATSRCARDTEWLITVSNLGLSSACERRLNRSAAMLIACNGVRRS